MKTKTTEWIEFAQRDISLAEDIMQEEYYANIVLFHCQQAIEKILKATLEEHSLTIPKIHNVLTLFDVLPGEVKTRLPLTREEFLPIEDIYIDMRYPSQHGILPSGFPTKEQAKEIFVIAKSIFDKVLAVLK
ncbi:MAG: HEPN domain-containing protein [Ignavibacteria bacterium]|nr:HEPN domain-containing protein [Ignavibacteria bacterium]